MTIIFDFNRTIFDPESNALFPGVIALLELIHGKHELVLITRNEGARKNRIEDLGLNQYFQRVIFVEQKNTDVFKEAAGSSIPIIVGDRVQDEISIGNELGYITVHVRQGIFADQIRHIQPTHSINAIHELEDVIKQYEK